MKINDGTEKHFRWNRRSEGMVVVSSLFARWQETRPAPNSFYRSFFLFFFFFFSFCSGHTLEKKERKAEREKERKREREKERKREREREREFGAAVCNGRRTALIVWRGSIFIIFMGHYHSFNETRPGHIYYLYIYTGGTRPAIDYNTCGRIDDDLQFIRDGERKKREGESKWFRLISL